MWEPLVGSSFERDCRLVTESELAAELERRRPNLLIAVKPLPTSFGLALALRARFDIPLLLDVDDPDLEALLSWRNPFKRAAKGVFRRREMRQLIQLRKYANTVPILVSNPMLQKRYGGTIIPHVREDSGFGAAHTSRAPLVAFIGTNRKHKGVRELRRAVNRLQPLGVRLIITAAEPADSKPWEQWVGVTTMDEGLALVSNSDIIVVPSRRGLISQFQLPAKLIDAMMAGRGIAVSNVGPLPWALGSGGVVFTPSSVSSMCEAIETLCDPDRRTVLGMLARGRAREFATVGGNLRAFENAVRNAIEVH